jgi:site-specific recombinase XerD
MSDFRESLAQYIETRRALGTEYKEPAITLGHFVEFLEREGAEFITTELALRWACERKGVQRATWSRRLSMVRRFASWLSAFDPRTQIPPVRILNARHRRNKPYIFSDQEIERLISEAARLPSSTGLRALTYVTLIGLLSSAGLRPGEALSLDIPSVDLINGILAIKDTKFGKSRFVPIADSTRTALAGYAAKRLELCRHLQTDKFLVSERGTGLCSSVVRRTFAKVSCAIGLRAAMVDGRIGRGPRLQDMRHTFATRKIIEWYQAGMDVERELPKLSTYLGHVSIANTYWYIEAVPELLQLATDRLSRGGTL